MLGTPRSVGEDAGKDLRQVAHVGKVSIGDALAVSVPQPLQLARGKHNRQFRVGHRDESIAYLVVSQVTIAERLAVAVGDQEKAPQVFPGIGAPLDREKVDDLDEQA